MLSSINKLPGNGYYLNIKIDQNTKTYSLHRAPKKSFATASKLNTLMQIEYILDRGLQPTQAFGEVPEKFLQSLAYYVKNCASKRFNIRKFFLFKNNDQQEQAIYLRISRNILSLPCELLEKIVSYVSNNDLIRLQMTCRRFFLYSFDWVQWRAKIKYGISYPDLGNFNFLIPYFKNKEIEASFSNLEKLMSASNEKLSDLLNHFCTPCYIHDANDLQPLLRFLLTKVKPNIAVWKWILLSGNLSLLKEALKRNKLPTVFDDGQNALHLICRSKGNNQVACLNLVIEKLSPFSINEKAKDGRSPLFLACTNLNIDPEEQLKLIRLLTQEESDVQESIKAVIDLAFKPLISQFSVYHLKVSQKRDLLWFQKALKILLENRKVKADKRLFAVVLLLGEVKLAEKLLIDGLSFDINEKIKMYTPLMLVTKATTIDQNSKLTLAKLLLKNNADPNISTDDLKRTVLHYVARDQNPNISLIKELFSKGDVKKKDSKKMTPKDYLCANYNLSQTEKEEIIPPVRKQLIRTESRPFFPETMFVSD